MAQTALVDADVLAGPFTLGLEPAGGSGFTTLGITDARGVRLLWQPNVEAFDSDQYGEGTFINGIYKGGNLFVEFKLREANKSMVKALAFPFNETSPGYGLETEQGVVGQLISAAAAQLKITPIAGTRAASETNPVRTFGCVVLAPGFGIDMDFAARLREVPIRLLCLPYISSSRRVWYTRAAS